MNYSPKGIIDLYKGNIINIVGMVDWLMDLIFVVWTRVVHQISVPERYELEIRAGSELLQQGSIMRYYGTRAFEIIARKSSETYSHLLTIQNFKYKVWFKFLTHDLILFQKRLNTKSNLKGSWEEVVSPSS